MPGLPLAVGGPSRNVNGESFSLLDSIDSENVDSSSQIFIRELSSETGSSSPGDEGTVISHSEL